MPPMTRRKFLTGLAALGAGGAATAGYARWIEPNQLEVTTRLVPLAPAKARPVLRVLQLSDLHASAVVPLALIARAIDLGLAHKPDLIALTGDFITTTYDRFADYGRLLARLSAAAPTFACPGNHDGGAWARRAGGYATLAPVRALLNGAGIPCLENEWRALTVAGRRVQLVGAGDFWSGDCTPAAVFPHLPERNEATRIVLNHNPDAKELFRAQDWDLMLCGHTHGGQLRLPFLGAPFAPVVDKRYMEGLHPWEGRWLHTTRGVGNLHGVRFNCPPEVSVLDVA